MASVNDIVLLWKVKADNDIRSIENELSSLNPVTDSICYHAQQAAEKYLKLFLVAKGFEPVKTHSLVIILNACVEIDKSFSALSDVVYLSEYAVELRYPDNFYIPKLEEAKEAFADARRVREFVSEILHLDSGYFE
ncbi:MAG TPA: HEPN domain-containing protein [Spirochaetota bacterium]